MYVTYQDLVAIGIFVAGLTGLCYTIFRKEIAATTTIVTAAH